MENNYCRNHEDNPIFDPNRNKSFKNFNFISIFFISGLSLKHQIQQISQMDWIIITADMQIWNKNVTSYQIINAYTELYVTKMNN